MKSNKRWFVALLGLFFLTGAGFVSQYTGQQMDEAIRKALTPTNLFAVLSNSYTTPTITATTPTKLVIPLTDIFNRDFDYDSVNNRFYLSTAGIIDRGISFDATISTSSSTPNILASFMLYKNGVLVTGSRIDRRIATANDVGALSLSVQFNISTNDYLEAYLEVSSDTTLTFTQLSAKAIEVN